MDTSTEVKLMGGLEGIVERDEDGLVVLSPAAVRPFRRVLFVNSYGGRLVWEKVKRGALPGQHLWGCLELVRMGYEVALAEPLPHFYLYRNPLPHDLKLLKMARSWLGSDGILYCAHTLLYWLPLLKQLGLLNRNIVSLTYAREELDFCRAHSGIIAMTPAAADQAGKMAPKIKCAHLGWGVDPGFFPRLTYNPEWFLSCGITHRDFATLSAASAQCDQSIRVICPGIPKDIQWRPNVTVIDGGAGWNFQDKKVGYRELLHEYYARCAASLIVIKNDPTQYTAVGFTNLLEAMAMARPVIVTRTGAVPAEIDVEKAGCGLHVPPENSAALADAINALAADPCAAQAMGEAGRNLVETHYNMQRYATELHLFFESL